MTGPGNLDRERARAEAKKRGAGAATILENPVFQQAFSYIEEQILSLWRSSERRFLSLARSGKMTDEDARRSAAEERESLFWQLHAADVFRRALTAFVSTGRLESLTEAQEQQEQSSRDRAQHGRPAEGTR